MSFSAVNRKEAMIRSIGVGFVRYLCKFKNQLQYDRQVQQKRTREQSLIVGRRYGSQDAALMQPATISSPGKILGYEQFPRKVFQRHLENVVEPISPALEAYCNDFCNWLAEEMLNAGILSICFNEKGEAAMKATIPFKESKRRIWLERKLMEWHGPLVDWPDDACFS